MARSVLATQLAQVMPVIGSSMMVSWSLTRVSVPGLKRYVPRRGRDGTLGGYAEASGPRPGMIARGTGSEEARDHGHLGPAARDHRPRAARGAAARAPARHARQGARARPVLPPPAGRGRVRARRPQEPGRPRRAALHREDRLPRQLPLRPVRGPAERGRRDPLLVGHDGQGGGRRLHQGRPRDLDRARLPPRRRRRRPRGGRRADRLRLRHVHRRVRPALRPAEGRRRACCPSAPATPPARSSS